MLDGKLNVCFIPGTPFASCDEFTREVVGGISVDYAVTAFKNYNWNPTCITDAYKDGAFDACDVLLGKVGNIEAARYGGGEGFDIAPPYFSSRISLLYASEFDSSTGWGFLEPFSLYVWVIIWISVVVSSLAAMLISKGKKMSFIRTAPTAMVGATRLYDKIDASYFQHMLSISMAIYSTVVFSLYSSNLLLFSFFKQGKAKKLSDYTLISPWTHEWLARRDFPANEYGRMSVVADTTGAIEETVVDLLRRGTHALLLEKVVLDGVCGVEPDLCIHRVDSLRTTFFPFVRRAVMEMEGMYENITLASGLFGDAVHYKMLCQDETPLGTPSGVSFLDVWGLFALVGGGVGIVIVLKIFYIVTGR